MGKLIRKFYRTAIMIPVFLTFSSPPAQALDIISALIGNGYFHFAEGGVVSRPLLCEGDIPCAMIEGEISGFTPQPDGTILVIFGFIKICEGDSCLTVRNALFLDNLIPELDADLQTAAQTAIQNAGIVSSPVTTWVASTSTMTQHDPVPCAEGTGKYSDPQCVDFLNFHIDFRCLVLSNFDTSEEFTFSGTWIVTRATP